ncbi:MAG: hypothetical protein AAGA87_10925 [Pseudomonadota bacterium]
MCLFLEDLKTYAADRGLVETAAAIEAAVEIAEKELASRSDDSVPDDEPPSFPSEPPRGKLQ